MRVLIAGSHGLIGSALVERLVDLDHDVTRLVRKTAGAGEINWKSALEDNDQLEGFNAIVNLAGVGIGQKRWRQKEKGRIWDSRVAATETLAQRLGALTVRPEVFVCASAVGYYGDGGDRELTEADTKGEGFLAELCANWEDATKHASEVGIRVVNIRSGIVLSPKGGALAKQLPLFRLGLGGRMGNGTQYTSWISLHDEVEAIVHVLTHKRISGAVNLTAPEPVTNSDFTALLGASLARPTYVPAWTWLLNLGFGRQMTDEVLLASQRAVPRKLMASGFSFRDRTLEEAFDNMFVSAEEAEEAESSEVDPDDGDYSNDVIDLATGTKSTGEPKKKRRKK